MTRTFSCRLAALCSALVTGTALAATLQTGDFAWQAGVELAPGTVAARLALPADALMASRTGDLADLRLLNAQGEPVAFALRRAQPAAPTPVRTASYPAYPLSRVPSPASGTGDVQVRVNAPDGQAVWVRMGAGGPEVPAATLLPAVLFDLRQENATLQDLVLQAELPANRPVRITAATSTDLAQWTPLPLQGSVYRFDGASPLDNRTLPLERAQSLQGRYLRLSWDAQPGLAVSALSATVASPAAPSRVRGSLPPARQVDGALEWTLGFATRIAAVGLSTPQANSLVPVRLLGRQEAAQPWRELGRAAVFRIGAAGAESTNGPIPVGTAVRHLRLEPLGTALALPPLTASVEFDAVEAVFLATGAGPFRLVAGRAGTPPGDVPLATLAAAVPRPDELPLARLGAAQVKPAASPHVLASWLPAAGGTTLTLWAVLGAGVLALALVAWRVLAQVNAAPSRTPADPVSGDETGPR